MTLSSCDLRIIMICIAIYNHHHHHHDLHSDQHHPQFLEEFFPDSAVTSCPDSFTLHHYNGLVRGEGAVVCIKRLQFRVQTVILKFLSRSVEVCNAYYAWNLSRWGSGKGKQCDWRVCQALLKATHCFRSLGTFWKIIFFKKKRKIHRSCHNGYHLEHHSNDFSQTLQTFHSSTNVFRLFRQSGRTLQLTGMEAFLVSFEIWESFGAFSKWLHSTFLLVSSWHLPLSGNTWELEGQTDIVSENYQSCKLLLRWPHCDAFVLMQRHSQKIHSRKTFHLNNTLFKRWINSKWFNVWLQHK